MRSLKSRLAVWVLLPTALLVAVDLLVVYAESERIATSVQQQLLRGSARIISEQLVYADGGYELTVPPAAFELFKTAYRDRVFYAVHTQEGRLVSGGDELPAYSSPLQVDEEAFFLARIGDEPVRVIALAHALTTSSSNEYAVTQVAQTLRGRNGFRDELIQSTMRGHVLLLLIMVASLTLALHWTLKPLIGFGALLSQREPGSLSRLDTNDAPSELEPVIHALNDYVDRLGQTLSSYEKFVSNTAHHLRTSFAIITSQINFGKRDDGDPATRIEVLDAIHKTLGRCTRLVNQFLVLASAAQARQNQNRASEIDLAGLITGIIEALAPVAHQRQIELGVDEFTEGITLLAPANLVEELFSNLIDNAIQHMGQPGTITVSLGVDGTHARVRVADDGIGIPDAYRKKVFERFFRIDRSQSNGSGLGLAIVKEICDALGATIVLGTSAGGHGLQVDIKLPLAPESRGLPESR